MIYFVYSIFSWLKIQLSTPKFILQLIIFSIWSSIKSDHAIFLLSLWPSITHRIKSKHFSSPVHCHITNNPQYSGFKYDFISRNSDSWLGGFSNYLIWSHSCSNGQLGEEVLTSLPHVSGTVVLASSQCWLLIYQLQSGHRETWFLGNHYNNFLPHFLIGMVVVVQPD